MKPDKYISPIPPDAVCRICGQYFKIGQFNRVLVHRCGEWMLTRNTSLEQVHRAIDDEAGGKEQKPKLRQYVTRCR